MKKFISNILVFLVLMLCTYSICYYAYSQICKYQPTSQNILYVWGDSQTYQGLILDSIENNLDVFCCSSAEHGAGVYDFLVFADIVPDNSECVIGMSEALLYRKISSDNNHSGTNYTALYELLISGYSIHELIKIAQTNHFLPKKNAFVSRHSVYPYADTIYYAEPLEGWKKHFLNTDVYHQYKQTAYSIGVNKLLKKGCRIHIIIFPLYKEIESFAKHTPNREKTNIYQKQIIERFNLIYDKVYIESDSLLMHDLSHLNEVGARLTTDKVIQHLKQTNINSILEVKIK